MKITVSAKLTEFEWPHVGLGKAKFIIEPADCWKIFEYGAHQRTYHVNH